MVASAVHIGSCFQSGFVVVGVRGISVHVVGSLVLLVVVVLMRVSVVGVVVTMVVALAGIVLAGVNVGVVACAGAVGSFVVVVVANIPNRPSATWAP